MNERVTRKDWNKKDQSPAKKPSILLLCVQRKKSTMSWCALNRALAAPLLWPCCLNPSWPLSWTDSIHYKKSEPIIHYLASHVFHENFCGIQELQGHGGFYKDFQRKSVRLGDVYQDRFSCRESPRGQYLKLRGWSLSCTGDPRMLELPGTQWACQGSLHGPETL